MSYFIEATKSEYPVLLNHFHEIIHPLLKQKKLRLSNSASDFPGYFT